MKKNTMILLLFVNGIVYSYSQIPTKASSDTTTTTTAAKRIAAMDHSKSDIISKSRRLLVLDFNEGNKEGVAQTLDYLATEVDDIYHLSLWNDERYLLLYWLGRYSDILESIQLMAQTAEKEKPVRPIVYPSDHLLQTVIQEGIRELYYDEIVADYESMHFSPDGNDFLNLFLDYLLDRISISDRNRLSDAFVRNYPESPWVDASKRFISYKFAAGDYGFGWDFGGGAHFASGPITDRISQWGGLTMNFNFYAKKFHIGFSVISSFGRVLQDIQLKQNGKTWGAGESAEIDKLSITGGMKIWEYKRASLSPFAGVSFHSAGYSDQEIRDNPELKDINLGTSIAPVLGFDLDFRLNEQPLSIPPYGYYGVYHTLPLYFWALGVKVAYYPNVITTQGPNLRGSACFVGVVAKMNFFSAKRVY